MKAKPIVIIFLAIVLISCTSVPKPSDQDFENKSKAIRDFATALLSADTESAKSLSAPGQWNKIDEWIKAHDPVSCKAEMTDPASLMSPELSDGSWFTSGRFDEQSGEWLVDLVYECQVESVNYCFEMNGTRIEKTNDEWQIIGWDTICENGDDLHPCSNMCP
jgi:hypothetical protein